MSVGLGRLEAEDVCGTSDTGCDPLEDASLLSQLVLSVRCEVSAVEVPGRGGRGRTPRSLLSVVGFSLAVTKALQKQ